MWYISTFLPAVLSWLLKCKLLHHRLKVVTAMSEFHPCGGTRHLVWDEGFVAWERERGQKAEDAFTHDEGQKLSSWRGVVSSEHTDLVGGHDTGLLVAEFHSQLSASLRSHPCTHTLPWQSRHRPRPSACTPCHCHLTTGNWCHSVGKWPECRWRSCICGDTPAGTLDTYFTRTSDCVVLFFCIASCAKIFFFPWINEGFVHDHAFWINNSSRSVTICKTHIEIIFRNNMICISHNTKLWPTPVIC